jgi:PBP1b-binding outer membrane lipoprotein LpoB
MIQGEKMKRVAKVASTIGLAILLSGCAVSAPGASATPAATPTTEPLGRVSIIDEVRDAFIDQGGVCNWDHSDHVTAATASGKCSDQSVIMLFADQEDRDSVVGTLQSFKLEDSDLTLLVGENWIINSPEAEEMQATLGGEWITE